MRVDSLSELYDALRQSWDSDTAYAKVKEAAAEGSPFGQCYVTALVVQDYFGGEILVFDYGDGDKHFWNRLPDGREYDLTADQFARGQDFSADEFGRPNLGWWKPPLEGKGKVWRGWNPRYRKLSNRVREAL